MRKKRLLILVGTVCLSLMLLVPFGAACAKPAPAPAPAPAPTPQKTITIGASMPLSGFAAPWGIHIQRTLEIIVDDYNKAGGLNLKGERYLVKYVSYDDKYDATEGAIIANRLIYEDKVDVFTVYSGGAATAATEVSHKAGRFQYGTSFAEGEPSPSYPLAFVRNLRYPEAVLSGLPWMAENHPEIKRLAKIGPNSPTGKMSDKMTKICCPKLGVEVVAAELVEAGTTDFTPVLLKMLAQKPDVIDGTSMPGPSMANIVKQARELGYTGMFQHWSGPNLIAALEVAGAEAMEGFIAGQEYGEPLTPEQQEFAEKYVERFGPPFVPFAIGSGYTAWQVLFQAIEQAGTVESQALANAMATGEFDTLSGKARFGGEEFYGIGNQCLWPLWIAIVEGGQVKYLDKIDTGLYYEWGRE